GGGIYAKLNSGYTIRIENCRIVNNTASGTYGGGGVFAYNDPNVILINNVITGNTASGGGQAYGGGVQLVSLSSCTVTGNVVAQNSGTGGLYVSCNSPTVSDNRVWGNSSGPDYTAGGLYVEIRTSGSGLVSGNVITGNSHTCGSCSYAAGGLTARGSLTVRGNVITGNTGAYAVYAEGNVVFENNLIADNQPGAGYDAVHLDTDSNLYCSTSDAHTYRFVHNTVARNGNTTAVKIPAPPNTNCPATAYITNTIIYSHAVGVRAVSSSTAHVAHSILSNTVDITGDVTLGTQVMTHTDPLFLADGYHIADNSPAKDVLLATGFDYTDIDGQPRLMGPFADIGADEAAYTATLALSKARVGSGQAHPGQPITYTLAVSPLKGTVWTADVRVVDRITSAYPLAGISGSGPNVACQAASSVITCTFHNVPTDAVRAATVVVTPAKPIRATTQGVSSPDNLGILIPDNGCGSNNYAEHTLNVNASGTIVDVDVFIGNLQHTYDGDLNIYVRGPDGTEVELSTGNGGSGDNYIDTIFDDEAATSITNGSPPFTGRFRPEGSLSAFDGKDPNGNWTLRVCDAAEYDTGTLNGWGLTLTLRSPLTQAVSWVITDTASMEVLDAYDPVITDNVAGPVAVPALYAPDLWVTKAGPSFVEPGHTFTYTLRWGNQGQLAAEGTVLTDRLPSQVNFVAATGNPVRVDRYLTWTLGTVSTGTAQTYLITVTVPDGVSGGIVLTNTAGLKTITALDPLANNLATVTTTVYYTGGHNFTVRKRAKPVSVTLRPGDNVITYNVTVQNIGTEAAQITARDPIPQGTRYVPGSAQIVQGSGTVQVQNDTLLMQSNLSPGDKVGMQFQVRVVSPDGAAPGLIRNRVTITVPDTIYQWTAQRDTVVKYHDLGVEVQTRRQVLWRRSQSSLNIPGVVIYRNAGTDAAAQSVLSLRAEGGQFVGAYPPPDEQPSPNEWRWNLGSLSPGVSGTIRYTFTTSSWSAHGYSVTAQIRDTDIPTDTAYGAPDTFTARIYPFRVQTEQSSRSRYYLNEQGARALYEYLLLYEYEHTDPSLPPLYDYHVRTDFPVRLDRVQGCHTWPPMKCQISSGNAFSTTTTSPAWSGDQNWMNVRAEGVMTNSRISATTTWSGMVGGETFSDTVGDVGYDAPPLLPPYLIDLGGGQHTPGCYSATIAANPNTTVTLRTSDGQYLGSVRTNVYGTATMSLSLPEGAYNLYAVSQWGSQAETSTVPINTNNVPWDPQRSYWTGRVQAGPLAGEMITYHFVGTNGLYSTEDWEIPGVYGFWNTTLHLYGSGSFCDQGIFSPTVTADGVTHSPVTTQALPCGNTAYDFNIGSAHTVEICARCVDGQTVYKEKCSGGSVLIDPDGFVFDVDKGGSYDPETGMFAPVQAVSGVTVTCYVSMPEWGGWVPWPAHFYGQVNPQNTNATYPDGITTTGYFAFFTPPGDYYLEVEGIPGYQRWRSPIIHVITQIVHVNVPYTPWPEEAAATVRLTPDGPDPAVITVTSGSAVEWVSTIRETDTLTNVVRWTENPILRPLSALDPLQNPLGFDGGYLEPGETYRRRFREPGVYTYTDAAGHQGTVVVVPHRVYLPLTLRRR
ncbi:MAG TPA: DUF11 domain-containing protein, partial [Chloroflexi bacterium]|nr:DUF11 domain-containing protein [Chloroflexota bacterium]